MTKHTLCDFTVKHLPNGDFEIIRTPEAHMQISPPIHSFAKAKKRRNVALHAIGLVVVITLIVGALVGGGLLYLEAVQP